MAYDGTVQGSPTFAAAKFDNGLTAVSLLNYIELPVGLYNFGATADWTIEAWLKDATAALLVAVSSSSASNAVWMGVTAAGNFCCSVAGGGSFGGVLDSGISGTDGNWHHVAMVMTGGTSLSIFVDGALKNTVTGTFSSPGATMTGRIGGFQTAGYAWAGDIDEVAFWNSAKYTGSYTPPSAAYVGNEANLRALYHLEADGTDSTGDLPPVTVTAATPVIGEYGPLTMAMSWAAATGGTAPYSYQVQRAPDGGGSPGTFANTGAAQAGLTFTDSGLSGSTNYWWRVIATDANDDAGTSDSVTKLTLATGTKYNRIDGTGDGTGRNVMVLIPNANAAIPYTGAAVPFLMYHHGASEDEGALLDDALKATTLTALLDAGYICAGISAYGDNWGNQAACDAYPDLYKFVTDRYSISKTLFLGQSMGGFTSLSSLAQHKIPNVVAWAGIYPACNLAAIYAAGGFTASINTAYSCTSTTYVAKTNGSDPYLKWGKAFRLVPMRFYASAGDTIISKATNTDVFQALVATSTPESTIVVCTGNHGDPSHFQPSDLVEFYERALASPPATSGIGVFVID